MMEGELLPRMMRICLPLLVLFLDVVLDFGNSYPINTRVACNCTSTREYAESGHLFQREGVMGLAVTELEYDWDGTQELAKYLSNISPDTNNWHYFDLDPDHQYGSGEASRFLIYSLGIEIKTVKTTTGYVQAQCESSPPHQLITYNLRSGDRIAIRFNESSFKADWIDLDLYRSYGSHMVVMQSNGKGNDANPFRYTRILGSYFAPTESPTKSPSRKWTTEPTASPTRKWTTNPPSWSPIKAPTNKPTWSPTMYPASNPGDATANPTRAPSETTSVVPTSVDTSGAGGGGNEIDYDTQGVIFKISVSMLTIVYVWFVVNTLLG